MGWLWKERRGPTWKRGWVEQTVTSISPPPFPLLAIFFIILLLLFIPSYFNYRYEMHQTVIGFKVFLLILPVLLILLAQFLSKFETFHFPVTKAWYRGSGPVYRSWDLPWGVVALLVVLIVMVAFHSQFLSMWHPLVYRPV